MSTTATGSNPPTRCLANPVHTEVSTPSAAHELWNRNRESSRFLALGRFPRRFFLRLGFKQFQFQQVRP